jgi:non-specific serine/threonine protein kinase
MKERGPQSAAQGDQERARRRWYFGRCMLDGRTHELNLDGIDTEIERRPLEVLIFLLQHAGEVCTKDELLAHVWPGRVLSETVLTKCIGRLREVLQDENQELIKTAYGFGYRFIAPVRVEIAPPPAVTRFEFRAGDHPVGRPLWSLIEKLGGGGQGEAWRARHDKTNELRVFKFALDESSLVTLKREITLFRVINNTLGASGRVVRLLDWNLEQFPYFVETEYIPGGNLLEWVSLRGGAAAVAAADRLELVARVADALSAIHSVGVLHKDLKPSNILVRPSGSGLPDIVLGDFGSGGIFDSTRLDSLGITRLGFTQTVTLYLAPEVLAGQPFTVKSDMYALGIILYQFICGDFHKLMSPGWERNIADELLREDIASMAEGNPAVRLSDAEGLARRLRGIEARRARIAAEREARAKAEKARRHLERAHARRFGLVLAFATLVAGLATSTALYIKARSAQERAEIAAAQSQAAKDFLSKDVFAPVSSGAEPVREMTVIQLLTRAGNEIDARFASQPDVAAELHYVIGRSFLTFLETARAVEHFRQALNLGEHLSGQGSRAAMRSASELIQVDNSVGQLPKTISRYNTILAAGRRQAGERAPEVLDLRLNLARGYYLMGAWSSAIRMFEEILADLGSADDDRSDLRDRARFHYGQLLTDLAEPKRAEPYLRQALAGFRARLGEQHVMVSEAHSALGRALADENRFPEAAQELLTGHELALKWAPSPSWTETRPRFFTALMFLHQDQPRQAEPLLLETVRFEDDNEAAYLQAHAGLTPELDHTGPVRQALGEAYEREGRLSEAVETLQRAVMVLNRANGAAHPQTVSATLSLVEALIADHRADDAKRVVGSIPSSVLGLLPTEHPILAQWYRVNGLLNLAENDLTLGREELTRALDALSSKYGSKDWRVVRVRRELELASNSGMQRQ